MLNQSAADVHRIAALARVLNHPKRLAILDLLMQGVQCNCELAAALGVGESLISHHMRILQESGLVQAEHDELDSRWVYYAIDVAQVGATLDAMHRFLDVRRIQPRQPNCGPRAAAGGCCS